MDVLITIDVINTNYREVIVMNTKKADNKFLKIKGFYQIGKNFKIEKDLYHCTKVSTQIKKDHVSIAVRLIKL